MEIGTILVAVTLTLLFYLFQKYFIKIYEYWPKRGVPCAKSPLPFFGNSLPVYLFRQDFSAFCMKIYNDHENSSMVGYYQNRTPALILRDPELVKTALISGFANFHDNQLAVDPELDPLLEKNPFFSTGDEWKKRRTYLTNALMSTKKLKHICSTVTGVCVKLTKYLEDNMKMSQGAYEVEAKELCTRFTGEVVACVGFGIEGQFFNAETDPYSFKSMVHGCFDQTLKSVVVFTVVFLAPWLPNFLGLGVLSKSLDRFFKSATRQVVAARLNDGVVRNDFFQMMMDAHTQADGEIDEDGVKGSTTSFFLDGYETSAITLSFLVYQVAANPDVQDRLRREVDDVLERHGGEISYEAITAMTYMDQVLNESMRLYPALGTLSRRCTETCKLVGNDGVECILEAGTNITVPLQALHMDPKYWENPEVYDPERFSPENKNSRPKTAFLPFGEGPRICVGMRFAVMQLKAAMVTILQLCSLELSPKTQLPLQVNHAPLKAVEGGLWVVMKPLQKKKKSVVFNTLGTVSTDL